jgi:LuxR family quorum-sensing system transcriptional regulator CciR
MDLFSFIECSNQTRSLSALFELLVSCATEEGFTEVAYGALTHAEAVRLPAHPPPAVAMNFPQEWCDHYFERKYYEIDPVVRRAAAFSGPFVWDQLGQRCQLQSGEQLVLAESREAGLKNGMSVPLFGPLGRMSHLNALAWQFHIAFAEIARPSEQSAAKIELTARERECLRWTAEGKSSWDIGMILKISNNTVNFHIKNAMRKFGTASRTVAVVKAIRLNLIELSGPPDSSLPM